jgi:hypothetical protein
MLAIGITHNKAQSQLPCNALVVVVVPCRCASWTC